MNPFCAPWNENPNRDYVRPHLSGIMRIASQTRRNAQSLATLSVSLVGVVGLEPTASCSQSTHATNCATPRISVHPRNSVGACSLKDFLISAL